MHFEVVADRASKVILNHTEQIVQMPSYKSTGVTEQECEGGPWIYVKSTWVRHVGYQDLHSDAVTMVWNPCAEVRPDYANKRHGENRGKQVCVLPNPELDESIMRQNREIAERRQPPSSGSALQPKEAAAVPGMVGVSVSSIESEFEDEERSQPVDSKGENKPLV